MKRASNASRPIVDFTGIGLCIGNELGAGLGRKGGMHLHTKWFSTDARYRGDVSQEVVLELFKERRVDGVPHSGQAQRIPTRRRLHDGFGRDVAASSRPVVDHERLAEPV